jgi:hypothetical protein
MRGIETHALIVTHHLLLGCEWPLLALLPALLLQHHSSHIAARTSNHLRPVCGHLFLLFVYQLLLLGLLDGCVYLGTHGSGLSFHGVAGLLKFLFGGRVAGADAQR